MRTGFPLRARLFLAASIFVVALATVLLVYLPKQLDRIGMRGAYQRADSVASLMSGAVTPGLAFEDQAAVGSALAALSHTPDVAYGAVFSKDAAIVARHPPAGAAIPPQPEDRKSTRLNSSHVVISYAVFCLKKKKCSE